eukprot:TRINITY_DN4348_c0_g1_i1.p1 TRINITY_DN4348_c0_g1~~TRINITY_DN4348_c0_g1_i1.p1  ORF type:complete len:127 (-),score=34.38 TRINITY_DN4348_c0_g1_i1:213-593(-)
MASKFLRIVTALMLTLPQLAASTRPASGTLAQLHEDPEHRSAATSEALLTSLTTVEKGLDDAKAKADETFDSADHYVKSGPQDYKQSSEQVFGATASTEGKMKNEHQTFVSQVEKHGNSAMTEISK